MNGYSLPVQVCSVKRNSFQIADLILCTFPEPIFLNCANLAYCSRCQGNATTLHQHPSVSSRYRTDTFERLLSASHRFNEPIKKTACQCSFCTFRTFLFLAGSLLHAHQTLFLYSQKSLFASFLHRKMERNNPASDLIDAHVFSNNHPAFSCLKTKNPDNLAGHPGIQPFIPFV